MVTCDRALRKLRQLRVMTRSTGAWYAKPGQTCSITRQYRTPPDRFLAPGSVAPLHYQDVVSCPGQLVRGDAVCDPGADHDDVKNRPMVLPS